MVAGLSACSVLSGADELTIAEGCLDCGPDASVIADAATEGAAPDASADAGIDAPVESPGGFLDASFGVSGFVSSTLLSTVASVAVRPDGKIVAAGKASTAVAALQLGADGAVDPGFGTAGRAMFPAPASVTLTASGVALDAAGRVVVGGEYFFNDGMTSARNMLAVRFTRAGQLDQGFGDNGRYRGGASNEQANAVAIGPGDTVLLAGQRLANASLVRLTADGTPDATFGSGGRSPVNPTGGAQALAASATAAVFAGRTIGGDVVVGKAGADGAPDAAFGGSVVTDVGSGDDRATAVAIQPDGKVIVAAETVVQSPVFVRSPRFAVLRYGTDGKLDPTFGQAGVVLADFDPGVAFQTASDRPRAIVLDARGRIVVVGTTSEKPVGVPDRLRAVALRLLPDGSLDPLFGDGGKMTFTDPASSFEVRAAAAQPDGKIVVVGAGAAPLMIARIVP